MKSDQPWIDRHAINYAYEKYVLKLKCDKLQKERDEALAAADSSNIDGRPKGSTKVSKGEMEHQFTEI